VSGPYEGHQLRLLPHYASAFWFAWSHYHPETDLVAGEDLDRLALPAVAAAPLAYRREA
jgi:hypothetical protein